MDLWEKAAREEEVERDVADTLASIVADWLCFFRGEPLAPTVPTCRYRTERGRQRGCSRQEATPVRFETLMTQMGVVSIMSKVQVKTDL